MKLLASILLSRRRAARDCLWAVLVLPVLPIVIVELLETHDGMAVAHEQHVVFFDGLQKRVNVWRRRAEFDDLQRAPFREVW